jgi:hypothetical protein
VEAALRLDLEPTRFPIHQLDVAEIGIRQPHAEIQDLVG